MGAGVSAESGNADLISIMEGGENFAARMTAWANAKKGAEEALADLKLGRNVHDLYADAQAKQDAARTVINNATAKATAIMAQARADADAVTRDAASKTKAALDDAATQRASADAYAEQAKASSDRLVSDAQSKSDQAKQKLSEAQAASEAAKSDAAQARQALSEAKQREAFLRSVHEKISTALKGS